VFRCAKRWMPIFIHCSMMESVLNDHLFSFCVLTLLVVSSDLQKLCLPSSGMLRLCCVTPIGDVWLRTAVQSLHDLQMLLSLTNAVVTSYLHMYMCK